MIKNFFNKVKEKFVKGKDFFVSRVKRIFSKYKIIGDELYSELEEALVGADIGYAMSTKIVNRLEEEAKKVKEKDPEQLYFILKNIMKEFLNFNGELHLKKDNLNVILVIGVNGVGKTTTIGKLASQLSKDGYRVILGAADTFRAAAVEQLQIWAERAGVDIVKQGSGVDPAAVVFDTIKAARSREKNVVIIDTAGRLHNKEHLMLELSKIERVIKKELKDGDVFEKLLVLDATMGQNALIQAETFNKLIELSGVVLTKMDGSSKGGIIFSISDNLKKPVKFIGLGEQIEDLEKFDAESFVEAIFDQADI